MSTSSTMIKNPGESEIKIAHLQHILIGDWRTDQKIVVKLTRGGRIDATWAKVRRTEQAPEGELVYGSGREGYLPERLKDVASITVYDVKYYVFLQATFEINESGERVPDPVAPETVIRRNIYSEADAQALVREIDKKGYSEADQRIGRFARYDRQRS